MGEERNMYKVLVEKPEGKRQLGRPRRRWEDGIRMYCNKFAGFYSQWKFITLKTKYTTVDYN
jgi:hypothetical protein